MSTRTVEYGRKSITYRLERADSTHLSISVKPDCGVIVRAPRSATLTDIDLRVQRRGGWVIRRQEEFAVLQPLRLRHQYVSGETHRYLGRQYRLKIKNGEPACIKLIGGYFEVIIRDRRDNTTVRRLVDTWYRERAASIFRQAIAKCLETPPLRQLPPPSMSVRRMSKRWGSCTTEGQILLNPALVRTPRSCIEYVVAHELCHLVEHHHGERFYRLLSRVQPDWKRRRERLNRSEL